MKSRSLPNPRSLYIRLLENVARESFESAESTDAVFGGELIEEGYVTGEAVRNGNGTIQTAVMTGITLRGRLFLQALKNEEHDASFLGWSKRYGGIVIGYLMATLGPVLAEWIGRLLNNPKP